MDDRIDELLKHVEESYNGKIQRGARKYLEANSHELTLILITLCI